MSSRKRGRLRRVHRAGSERGAILQKLLVLLVILALAGVLYLLREPLLGAAGRFWVVDGQPQASDAIVILSDDNVQAQRAARAAELYHAGWAPVVVASGRILRPYASIADLMNHDLQQRGVPAAAIVKFPNRASNTRDEAQAVRGLCQEHGWHRLLIVTSNYHTRRARYIFRRIMPTSVQVRVVATADSAYDPNAWWRTREGLKFFFLESVGFPLAVWELRHASARGASDAVPVAAPVRP